MRHGAPSKVRTHYEEPDVGMKTLFSNYAMNQGNGSNETSADNRYISQCTRTVCLESSKPKYYLSADSDEDMPCSISNREEGFARYQCPKPSHDFTDRPASNQKTAPEASSSYDKDAELLSYQHHKAGTPYVGTTADPTNQLPSDSKISMPIDQDDGAVGCQGPKSSNPYLDMSGQTTKPNDEVVDTFGYQSPQGPYVDMSGTSTNLPTNSGQYGKVLTSAPPSGYQHPKPQNDCVDTTSQRQTNEGVKSGTTLPIDQDVMTCDLPSGNRNPNQSRDHVDMTEQPTNRGMVPPVGNGSEPGYQYPKSRLGVSCQPSKPPRISAKSPTLALPVQSSQAPIPERVINSTSQEDTVEIKPILDDYQLPDIDPEFLKNWDQDPSQASANPAEVQSQSVDYHVPGIDRQVVENPTYTLPLASNPNSYSVGASRSVTYETTGLAKECLEVEGNQLSILLESTVRSADHLSPATVSGRKPSPKEATEGLSTKSSPLIVQPKSAPKKSLFGKTTKVRNVPRTPIALPERKPSQNLPTGPLAKAFKAPPALSELPVTRPTQNLPLERSVKSSASSERLITPSITLQQTSPSGNGSNIPDIYAPPPILPPRRPSVSLQKRLLTEKAQSAPLKLPEKALSHKVPAKLPSTEALPRAVKKSSFKSPKLSPQNLSTMSASGPLPARSSSPSNVVPEKSPATEAPPLPARKNSLPPTPLYAELNELDRQVDDTENYQHLTPTTEE